MLTPMEKLIHQGNSNAICFRAVYLIPEQVSVAAAFKSDTAFSIDNTKVQLFFAGVITLRPNARLGIPGLQKTG